MTFWYLGPETPRRSDAQLAIAAAHRPISAGNPKRPTVICSECMVVWPCLAVHQLVSQIAHQRAEVLP